MAAHISDVERRITQARTTLLLDQPFFGMLSLKLRMQEDPSCATAWTDGRSLGYNAQYIAGLTDAQLQGLIAHEVMHCACGHPWRRDAREMKRWNIAADYAINAILTDAKFELPDGALLDSQYAGKHAEWIYDRLPPSQDPNDDPSDDPGSQDSNQPGQQPGAGAPDVRDAPTEADAPTESEWQQDVRQASKQSRGTMTGGQKADVAAATAPTVDWRTLLRKYAQEVAKADYSWQRPNTRYIPLGLFLPALHSIACGPLVIAIDTSGSIDDVLLTQFATEVRTIADDIQPAYVDVVYCDTQIHRRDRFERGDTVVIAAVGRGGTSFEPVFEQQAETGEVPACLIYLTDLDGSFPDVAPDYPVIWAAYGTTQIAPFGDTVNCE